MRDEVLVNRYLQGETEAFNELASRYQGKLYRLAYKMLGNHDDAQDAVQEVNIRLLKSLQNFRATAKFGTWLYRLAANTMIDFFDVENHPTITFTSASITRKDEESYEVNGELTIRGTTRPVTLDLVYEGSGKDPWGNEKAGLSITGRVNRKDFGLQWNVALEAGGVLVGDQVKIEVHAQAMKQAEANV